MHAHQEMENFLKLLDLIIHLTNPHTVDLNEERVLYWLDCGAQPTIQLKVC